MDTVVATLVAYKCGCKLTKSVASKGSSTRYYQRFETLKSLPYGCFFAYFLKIYLKVHLIDLDVPKQMHQLP